MFSALFFCDAPEDRDLELAQQNEDDLADITQEWVEEMEEKIESSLVDVETHIQRLHQLCRQILTADANKTKSPTTGKNKVDWYNILKKTPT